LITHANTDLVARAWLQTLTGIPTNKVGTTVPADTSKWSASGFVQTIVTGGNSALYYGLRRPVVVAHCWAVNPNANTPPWGKAADLAEAIVGGCHADTEAIVSLGVTGAPQARVLSAWVVNEPQRVVGDVADYAHYVVDFQIAWVELNA
jgi:hypothetical protein